jgi:hypothetical protein
VFPAVADTPVGAAGTVAGITALDGADAGPVPRLLVAVTVNVYELWIVSPVTVAVVAGGDPLTVVAAPPGEAVTV